MNRTGIATAPERTERMLDGMAEFPPDVPGDEGAIALTRVDYATSANPIGSVPPPLRLKGMLKSALQATLGESPTQFIDKLGERLAFERTGVRLYLALLAKFDAYGSFEGGPTRSELELILRDEYSHFRMLHDAVTRLGGDPTVVTPSADLQATMSKGIMEVVVDPRTTLAQGLEAMLLAELADNDCWLALGQLAKEAGEADLSTEFERALNSEMQHLAQVRAWIAAAQGRSTASASF
jgi:rubrerythrin